MITVFSFFLQSLALQLVSFISAYFFQMDAITDSAYVVTFISFALEAYMQESYTLIRFIPALCIIVWGLRLGSYLLRRIIYFKKDKRFDGIREDFFKFLLFFLFQGCAVFLILLPTFLFLTSDKTLFFSPISFFAVFVWTTGFLIEAVADHQKFSFLKRNTGISGIPLLEKEADSRWGHEAEYQKYKKQTSILIPWFSGK